MLFFVAGAAVYSR